MSEASSRIGVAVVNYNTREHLRACLASVLAEQPVEVVVADNGSTDGSVEMVQEAFPDVDLVVDPTNPGYGVGANNAIESCAAPYVLLLNSDTRLRPGALTALTAYLDAHPGAGVVGPRLLNPDGSLQRSCYPFLTPVNWLLAVGDLGPKLPLPRRMRQRWLLTWPHDESRRVPWVKGAALTVRRTAFDAVAGFDPSFFLYSEEVDLCYRLARAGWETHFTPAAEVVHVEGASTEQDRRRTTRRFFESSVQFNRTHHSAAAVLRLKGLLAGLMVRRIMRDRRRLRAARTPAERGVLEDNLAVWRELLRDLRRL